MSDLTDVAAERQLLSIALTSGVTDEFLTVPVTAYAGWQQQAIAAALHDLHARHTPTDPAVVMRTVRERAGTDQVAQQLGAIVADLATHYVPAAGGGYYAERITALSTARTVAAAAARFQRDVAYAAENDDDTHMVTASTAMRAAITEAETAFRPAPPEPPMSLKALLDYDGAPYDWLVPGLMERGDRLIVTGFEGLGKSMLLAQFAVTIAAGLHPFTGEPIGGDKFRVLVFDVENPLRQLQRRYRRIRGQVDDLTRQHGMPDTDWSEAMRIVSRPEGVSLTTPRELSRIEQAIGATAPDLVLAGPLYKMSSLDIRDEQAALELCATLDSLRVRHHFTLVAEAHAGHASDGAGGRRVRPIGSSVFLRWPEFGFGLAPAEKAAHLEHPSTVEVRHWRGARDERCWPRLLEHGSALPWQPGDREYWDRAFEWTAA